MKILFVHNRYVHEGGEERVIDNLSSLFQNHGHLVVRFEQRSQDWLSHGPWQKLRDAAAVVYSRTAAKELASVIAREKPDVVHIHNVFPVLSPSVYDTAAESGIPVIQSVHNYRLMCVNGLFLTPRGEICERCRDGRFASAVRFGCYQNSRIKTLPMAFALGWHRRRGTFLRSVRRYWVPNSFLKDKMSASGFPAAAIDLVPNPAPSFSEASSRSAKPLVVYAGRLSREKGILTLLQAAKEVPDVRLALLGDGPLASSAERMVRDHQMKHVELTGRLPPERVSAWLQKAWSVVMPSECYENLPQAILESWSSGTPAIVSDGGALENVIRHGETGWHFKRGNIASLAEALRRLCTLGSDDRDQMAARCREEIQSRYSEDAVYQSALESYQRAGVNVPAFASFSGASL